MLPGTVYSPERILKIVARRAWLILLLVGLGTGVAVGVSRRLPDLYRSETVIMLEPQRVPDEYVKSIAPIGITDQFATLQSQVLSRSRLERIINDLSLYSSLRRSAPMEDAIEQMRRDIDIKTDKASVRLAYVSRDAKNAQRVAERLSSLFIEENLRDRESLAEQTNGFLDSQLEDAKRQLIQHEKRLEEYRTRFGHELPSQATTNLQAMQNAQTQLQTSVDVSDRARDRRLLLERQVVDLESEQQPVDEPPPPAGTPELGKGSTADQLQAARAQLPVLLTRAKPDHPDVKALRRTIRDLEAKIEAESAEPPARSTASPSKRATAELLRQRRIRDLKDQIADIDRQLRERQGQESTLRRVIGEYQAKLDAVPKRESDLVELSRDYATLQTTYQTLLAKRQDAKIAANLERKNIGPQYKILDSPKVPERSFSPNRPLIDIGGAAAGLVLGFMIIGLLEYRDSTFKTEEEVQRLLNLRVLAVVPIIRPAARWRRRIVVATIAVIVIAGALAAVAASGTLPPF